MPASFDPGSPLTRSANAKINSAMYASLRPGSSFADGIGGRTPRIRAARSRASCRRLAMTTDSSIVYSSLGIAQRPRRSAACSLANLYPDCRLFAPARQKDAAKAKRQTRNGKETNALPEHQIGPGHRGRGRKVDEA